MILKMPICNASVIFTINLSLQVGLAAGGIVLGDCSTHCIILDQIKGYRSVEEATNEA